MDKKLCENFYKVSAKLFVRRKLYAFLLKLANQNIRAIALAMTDSPIGRTMPFWHIPKDGCPLPADLYRRLEFTGCSYIDVLLVTTFLQQVLTLCPAFKSPENRTYFNLGVNELHWVFLNMVNASVIKDVCRVISCYAKQDSFVQVYHDVYSKVSIENRLFVGNAISFLDDFFSSVVLCESIYSNEAVSKHPFQLGRADLCGGHGRDGARPSLKP